MPINALKLISKSGAKPDRPNYLPFFLVLGMAACLGLTAFVSYKLGDAALEGVSQPEGSSLGQMTDKSSEASSTEEKKASATKFVPINIEKVSKDTREYIKKQKAPGKDKANAPNADAAKDGDQSKAEADAEKKP